MFLHIVKLPVLKYGRRHIGILNPVIGKNRRREALSQVHVPEPLRILPRNPIIAGPELLLLLIGKPGDVIQKNLRLLRKYRYFFAGKCIRIHPHLLGRGNDDPHGSFLFSVLLCLFHASPDILPQMSPSVKTGPGTCFCAGPCISRVISFSRIVFPNTFC